MYCRPSRVTYCPYCKEPLSEREIAVSPEGEYPSHYGCRVRMQEDEEEYDANIPHEANDEKDDD